MNDHENCDLCGGIMRAGMEINPVSYVCVACGHTVYGCMDPALPEPSGEALQRVEVRVVFAGETPTMDELKRLRKLSRELRWVPVSTLLEKLKNTRTWPLGIMRRHETGLLLEQVAASGLHAEVFPPPPLLPPPPRRRLLRYGIPAIGSLPILFLYDFIAQQYRYPGHDPDFWDAILFGDFGTFFGVVIYHLADRARRASFLPLGSLCLISAVMLLILVCPGGLLDRPHLVLQYFLMFFLTTLPFGILYWLMAHFLARKGGKLNPP
ncbi:MAG TPA: hypothetical protein VHM91_12430 [Verrucomicrobiales bacterium]|nr:hypothetical protein [Verrucomicrobiales bacterium]